MGSEVTKDKVLGWIVGAMPYANQCKDFDMSHEDAIYFTWRSTRFRVSVLNLMVEEHEPPFLKGGNLAICVEQLIRLEMVRSELGRVRVETT